MSEVIVLKIMGKAAPAGSKSSFPLTRKDATGQRVPVYRNGRQVVRTVDANPNAKPWKESVEGQAGEQYREPVLTCPVLIEMIFFQPRPKSHYGTGRNESLLKDSAPAYPAKQPDVLKLARGVEDALTGIVYADDSRTVDLLARKRYVGRDEVAYVEVRIMPAPAQTVSDLVQQGQMEPIRPAALNAEQLSLDAALAPAEDDGSLVAA